MWRTRRAKQNRSGAAMLEFALAFPVFVTITLGMFEFGRVYMLTHAMNAAARQAGRIAVTDVDSTTEVINTAKDFLTDAGYDDSKFRVLIIDASPLDVPNPDPGDYADLLNNATPGNPYDVTDAEARQLMIVRVETTFQDVSLFTPRWMAGSTELAGQVAIRKE